MHIITKFCSFHIKIFNFNRRKSSEKPNFQASFNIKSKVYAYTDFFVLFLKFHHQSSAMYCRHSNKYNGFVKWCLDIKQEIPLHSFNPEFRTLNKMDKYG